ncbi:MAG: Phenylacetic acid catabolic protein [Pseudomonadota bacterium]|nr:Phenylacetic acid catabolic protein [Pseudomonadota bacterium]
MMNQIQVESISKWEKQPEEYKEACRKIVISHAINELYGSQVYDEPAIALAPNPYAKWLTCRVVMEEYGHHYRFFELGVKMGIPEKQMLPELTQKSPLSIMSLNLTTWEEFCVIKMLGDLGEILHVEELTQCTFHPLRSLARMTMPEEKFHSEFGKKFCSEICKDKGGRKKIQQAVNDIFPHMPAFFGRSKSKNNEIYRKWGLKNRTNDAVRSDYLVRAQEVVSELDLKLPELDMSQYDA